MVGKSTFSIPPDPNETVGAPQRWVWEVSKRLSKNHDVIVFSPGYKTAYDIQDGVPIFYKKKRKIMLQRPANIPFAFDMLTYYACCLHIVKHFDLDIVHFHSTVPHPVSLAKTYLRNTPVVLSVHQCVGFRTLGIPFKKIEDRLISYSFKRADAALPVSHYVERYLKSEYGLNESTKFFVTYCGVDPSLFKYDDKLRESARKKYRLSDDPVILFVGRVVPEKAPHVLVKAHQIIHKRKSHVKLVLAGPIQTGGKMSAYAASIIKKPHRGIRFIGPVNYESLVELYCAADIFVNPTIIPEAFGMVNVEAMACEKPVIATRIGAIPEVVKDGKTGILVPPNDVDAIVNAISYLMEDTNLARKMGASGRNRVLRFFTWKSVARRALKAYKETL